MLDATSTTKSCSAAIAGGPARGLEVAARTDIGLVRRRNEDGFACLPELGLFLVADGMGGETAGDVASRLALETICESVGEAGPMPAGADHDDLPLDLVTAIRRANTHIFSVAQREGGGRRMGTTIAGALVRGDHVVIAHVGDSRVYRLRDGALEQLTEDHSLAVACIRAGRLSPRIAARSPLRHAITRALGIEPWVEVDTRIEEIREGDVLLLCSDGLTGVLDADEITATIEASSDLEGAATRLVARANERGGPDNVTCVLVRLG